MPAKRSLIPSERQSQRTVVEYLRLKYPDVEVAASANGGSRNKAEAANLKKDGVLPGWPDLFIAKSFGRFPFAGNPAALEEYQHIFSPYGFLPNGYIQIYSGLFIEMKSAKGRVSPEQKRVIEKLRNAGYRVEVCYSADEAIKVIDEYLS